jgi:hypothetical protein
MDYNLQVSYQRIKSDWIEPETLFWAAWRVLPAKEKAAIAREAVGNFVTLVQEAASVDPRPEAAADPMEWHRHRVHPQLWEALEAEPDVMKKNDPVRDELEQFQMRRDTYLARRPPFSITGDKAPWDEKS